MRYVIYREPVGLADKPGFCKYWNFMDGWVKDFCKASRFTSVEAFGHVRSLTRRGFDVAWEVITDEP